MVMKVEEYKGEPGPTFQQASTDTAAGLTAANLTRGGRRATSCVIQVLDATIKLAVGGTSPVQGASSGVGYEIQDLEWLTLEGSRAVFSAEIISAVVGTPARVQVTPYFS